MPGASGVRLEPELVGDQHKAIVGALLERFQIDPATGRWALRPGSGGLVVLSGTSGAGKSRIVREVYRGLRAQQSQPGYWPELAPRGGATVNAESDGGLAVFGFRKSVGPDSAGFVWPAGSVPDFLWWQVGCQAASSGGFLDAQALFANELLRHQEPAQFGWARAAGGKRWATRVKELLPHAGSAVADEGKSEAVAALLAEAAGQSVPFGGLVTRSVQALTGAAIRAAARQGRLDSDTSLGAATGGREDPAGTLAGVVASLALPGFPVVVAVEDLHDADESTLELVARLTGPGFSDRVLMLATGWPEALSSRAVGSVSLADWLRSAGGEVMPVAALNCDAVAELVRAHFPGTAPDRIAAIARRWSNPLAVALVLDLLVGDGATDGFAITADDKSVAEVPAELAVLYDQVFAKLSLAARRAVILDVICGADAVTAEDFGRPPASDSTWTPVDPSGVLEAADRQGLRSEGVDHDTAVAVGWLLTEQDWLVPREPALAHAAWRAMRSHRLRGAAPKVRAETARILAGVIAKTARNDDGTQDGFMGCGLRESAWMVALAPALPDDRAVQSAAALAALRLFRHQAQGAPRDAVREWAAWAPSWDAVLGADDPVTLASRDTLARAYESVGDLGRAIRLYEQTLADRLRVLGADHPDTLASRDTLARAYESVGDLGRAIRLYEQTLADRLRMLGADHPDTLTSRNDLAGAYRSVGELGRAIALYEQTLAERRRVLGADHPDTSTSRNDLAGAYRSVGELGRAIALYEQTLAERRRVLGEDHPDTLASRNNLAYAYESAGDLGRAIRLYEQTLADMQRVLGPDHPDTLTSQNNLAGAYRSVGDLGWAIRLYERTLADRRRVLGAGHPATLTSQNGLAHAYASTGDLGRAIPLYEQSLAGMQRVLGEDHPDTLTARNNLAVAYQSAGDLGRAIPLYEQTLAGMQRVLGQEHPDTLRTYRALLAAQEADSLPDDR
jgi:tetratricopeptide (TPR) repeat protein